MVMQTNSSLIKKDKKMKSIKNILGTASMMVLALSATSCTDGNDWDVDGSLSRLFGLNGDKITVETAETSATVHSLPSHQKQFLHQSTMYSR